MTNRINGDFDTDSIEAFRSAYASRILSPEDQEVDERTGLPTDVVLNTSPWIQHTGLWKANDGTDKYFVPGQVLVQGEVEVESDAPDFDLEEIEALLDDILESDEDEGEFEDEDLEEIEALLREIEESSEEDSILEDLMNELGLEEDDEEDEQEGEEEEEDDLEELINNLLSEDDAEDPEEDLEALIESILSEEEGIESSLEDESFDEDE